MANLGSRLILIIQIILISHVYAKAGLLNNGMHAKTDASATPSEALRISLYLLNHDNSIAIADGVYAQYNSRFSDGVDIKDAIKLTNISENFAIKRDGVLLALERRQIISDADTLFFNLTQTRQRNYQLAFVPDKLNHPGLLAFLQDSYLKTSTPVDLNATTKINFYVNGDAGSAKPGRFRLVFASAVISLPLLSTVRPLPLTVMSAGSLQKKYNINMAWKVQNHAGNLYNRVERPEDSKQPANPGKASVTEKSDSYRGPEMRSGDISNGKKTQGIDILKSGERRNIATITLYPNPVINGVANLHFIDQAEGVYTISLSNSAGQIIWYGRLQHSKGSRTEILRINKEFAKGVYTLRVATPGKLATSINLLYE